MKDSHAGHLQFRPGSGEAATLELAQAPSCRIGALLADPAELQDLRQAVQQGPLRQSLQLERFDSPRDLQAAAARGDLDLFLIDAQGCADGSALEVCQGLREAGLNLPILVLCEAVGDAFAEELQRAGARHFLRRDEGLLGELGRLAQASQQELSQASAGLEEVDNPRPLSRRAALESMCRTLSHQLMSSVTSIQEFLSIVMDKPEALDTHQREYLNIARNSCEGLQRDMADMIAIAEMESCGIVIRPQVIALGGLVEAAIKPFYAVARRQSVELSYEVEVGLPPVMIDPVHGRRLMEILLRSVLGTVPHGRPIGVSVQQSELFAGGSEVRLAFSGPRVVSESELDQYFDLHYQVQKTTSRQEGDFGFGLHVCRELVDLHGGHIAAEMENGRVTAFVFHLRGITRAMATHDEWNSLERD